MKIVIKLLMIVLSLIACSKEETPQDFTSQFLGNYRGLFTTEITIDSEMTIEQEELSFTITKGNTENKILLNIDGDSMAATIQGNTLTFDSQNHEMNGIVNSYSGTGQFYIDSNTNYHYLRLDFYSTYIDENSSSSAHAYGDMKKQ